MTMGNQYGIDLGNILSTANYIDKLKSKKLQNKLNQMKIDEKEADIDAKYNLLVQNNTASQNSDDSIEPSIYGQEENSQTTLNRKEKIQAIKEAELKQKQEQQQKLFEARKKVYISQGFTPAMAEAQAVLDTKEVSKMYDIAKSSNEQQRMKMQQGLKQSGDALYAIKVISQKNPQEAEKRFQNIRNQTISQINELRKQGKQKEADQLEQQFKLMPSSLIKKDGNFNNDWIDNQLLITTHKIKTIEDLNKEDYLKKQHEYKQKEEKLKQSGEMSKLDKKLKNDLTIEKEKAKLKGKESGLKSSDESLINRAVWQNMAGIDINSDNADAQIAELSQDKRDDITNIASYASKLLKEKKASTILEAVNIAKKHYNIAKNPPKGTIRKKGGRSEIYDGENWVAYK